MRLLTKRFAIGATLLFAISGCSSSEPEPEALLPSAQQEEQTEAPISSTMTLWVTAQVAASLTAVAEQFEADTGVRIEIVTKDFGSMREALTDAAASDSGPDIFVGSHDWTGPLVSSGLISQLEPSAAYQDIRANALSAFAFDNALYGIPFGVENVALVCNTQLVPEQPANWEEVVAAGFEIAMGKTSGEPYHMFYLQSSFGANIFDQNPDGSYLPELAMAGDEGLAFANWLSVNRDLFSFMDYGEVLTSMANEELACWITGPWAWQSLADSLGEENLSIYDLPAPGANKPRGFLDAFGFFVSSSAKDPYFVNKFFREYLASEAAQTDIYETTGRIPAHTAVIKTANGNKKVSGFARAGVDALPRPNIQEMDLVWSPLGSAQAAILTGDVNPEVEWRNMIEQIESQIGG